MKSISVTPKSPGLRSSLCKRLALAALWVLLVPPVGAIATDANQLLFDAICQGNIDGVKQALQAQADVNAIQIKPRGLSKETPLTRAVDLGELEIVEILLQQGAGFNLTPSVFKSSLLSTAILDGDSKMVALLIKYDADVNPPGGLLHGQSPLYLATARGDLTIVRQLLNAGAKIIPGRWSHFKEIIAAPWNLLTGHVVDLGSPASLLDAAEKSGNEELYNFLRESGAR